MVEEQKPNIPEIDEAYFQNYEISDGDLVALRSGIETMANSGLIEPEVLDEIQFATFDAQNFYVLTRREHASSEEFHVEEIGESSPSGFRTFKIKHDGSIGRKSDDYVSAQAGLQYEQVRTTTVGIPHEGGYVLDIVKIPPKEAFERQNKSFHNGKFDYLTDCIFHEAGHVEQLFHEMPWRERLEDWSVTFPSEKQRDELFSILRANDIFPPSVTEALLKETNRQTIAEMYTMLIDREAGRRFAPERHAKENRRWTLGLPLMKEMEQPGAKHDRGRAFVHILEKRFPDFQERKNFVRSVLSSDE